MSGKVKKPSLFEGMGLPKLPADPGDLEIKDLRVSMDSFSHQGAMAEALLHAIEQRPAEFLHQNLGELRRRIVEDPESVDVNETLESYRARIEPTTLSEVLLAEARMWERYMQSENPALADVAFKAYHLVVGNESYMMSSMEAMRVTGNLLQRIGHGDLEKSKQALILYQRFLERFFKSPRNLIRIEASGFRMAVQDRIRITLGDESANVGEDILSHLNNLLVIYAQIVFFDGIEVVEIDDGINWISRYIKPDHPLVQCATEVCASLEMTRKDIEARMKPPKQSASVPEPRVQDLAAGNVQDPVVGTIDTTENNIRVGQVPALGSPKIVLDSFTASGLKKPV